MLQATYIKGISPSMYPNPSLANKQCYLFHVSDNLKTLLWIAIRNSWNYLLHEQNFTWSMSRYELLEPWNALQLLEKYIMLFEESYTQIHFSSVNLIGQWRMQNWNHFKYAIIGKTSFDYELNCQENYCYVHYWLNVQF